MLNVAISENMTDDSCGRYGIMSESESKKTMTHYRTNSCSEQNVKNNSAMSRSWAPESSTSGSALTVSPSAPTGTSKREKPDDLAEFKGKMETKLMTMWNNVKYGWTVKMKTNFSHEHPVWLLGRCYHRKMSSAEREKTDNEGDSETEIAADASLQQAPERFEGEGIEGFKSDFISRIWLTYRREFPILNGSNLTTDCGWGCMLRSGQMLLAQGLICHFLGRSWRWTDDRTILSMRDYQEDCYHRMVLKWFGDKDSLNSPFSIHQLVKLGETLGKKPGDWYGPGSVAHLLRAAVQEASKENYEFDDLCVYVARDGAVYLDDVREQCTKLTGGWKSLIMLVPVRLGTEKLNPIYSSCLTSVLSLENCIGIIGGKPKHSLYFVGYQDDRLIHLDPHYCQDVVDVWQPNFPVTSFHCRSPRKMPLLRMDPSCCIGFYCSDRRDFERFIVALRPFLIPPNITGRVEYAMFELCDGKSVSHAPLRHSIVESDGRWIDNNTNDSDTDMECEEFVIV